MATTPQEFNQPDHLKEEFLHQLSSADKENLKRMTQLFRSALKDLKRSGALLVVGGILTKPLPRPDIDLTIILGQDPSDPDEKDFQNHHLYALADFKIFKDITKRMVEKDSSFSIVEIQEPAIDIEFQSPNILSHEGLILVASPNKESTPIEFLRDPDRGDYKAVMTANSAPYQPIRPYVLLTDI